VPVVALVDGVKIMFFFADHAPPHFHVAFAGKEAQIRISTLEIMEGRLPVAKLRSVREWAATREKELMAAWQIASRRGNPGKIK
jgi:hypothetical protein